MKFYTKTILLKDGLKASSHFEPHWKQDSNNEIRRSDEKTVLFQFVKVCSF